MLIRFFLALTVSPIVLSAQTPAASTQAPVQDAKPAASTGVERIGNGVSAPVLLYAPNPEYSEQARQDKVSGTVLVGLVIDESGNPTRVRVLRGIGNGLDEKAIEAVRAYRFKPAMKDGQPVKVEINIQVNFQIITKPPA